MSLKIALIFIVCAVFNISALAQNNSSIYLSTVMNAQYLLDLAQGNQSLSEASLTEAQNLILQAQQVLLKAGANSNNRPQQQNSQQQNPQQQQGQQYPQQPSQQQQVCPTPQQQGQGQQQGQQYPQQNARRGSAAYFIALPDAMLVSEATYHHIGKCFVVRTRGIYSVRVDQIYSLNVSAHSVQTAAAHLRAYLQNGSCGIY